MSSTYTNIQRFGGSYLTSLFLICLVRRYPLNVLLTERGMSLQTAGITCVSRTWSWCGPVLSCSRPPAAPPTGRATSSQPMSCPLSSSSTTTGPRWMKTCVYHQETFHELCVVTHKRSLFEQCSHRRTLLEVVQRFIQSVKTSRSPENGECIKSY